ncbi:unnamed protein product [Paramecium octaurelia]|uniref:Uncharacterized protein n=1 Tax=Paramecium octaurelia TaxID=43137 RepID=A0A8S1UHD3_PAROT|nr:unnamed protein product [Paramecium octaurelia]
MNKQRKLTNFEEFRQDYFDVIADDRAKLFNFFFEYNRQFGFINQDDYLQCTAAYLNYRARTSLALFGSPLVVFIANKTVFRNFQRIPVFRPAVFSFKYLGIPLLSFYITGKYFCQDTEKLFYEMAEKYQFGFYQYNQAMDLLERAHKANRLDEFMEKGTQFDWTGIPELKKY